MSYIEDQLWEVQNAMESQSNMSGLYHTIEALLDNDEFCPEGGLLGFSLAEDYQVAPGQDLNDVFDWLGGRDLDVRVACEELGLGVFVNTILQERSSWDFWHESWSGGLASVDNAVDVPDVLDLDTSLLENILNEDGPSIQLLHPYDDGPCRRCTDGIRSKAIAWVRPLVDGQTGYELDGISVGGFPVREWVELSLIVTFGPAGDRKSWWNYEGDEYQGDD
ncbi:hypothetical protein L218DRAFT_1008979 [Marasmius fiardii PR-910]|nr:hypothetical protein L218DRAFT_1008979 [Marasmius fiardii PR-910]